MNDTRSVPTSAEAGRFYRLILKAAGDGTLRKLTFSLPAHAPLLPPRTTARLSELRGRAHLSCEQTLQKGKVQHLHIPSDDPEGLLLSFVLGYDRVFLSTSLGDAELMRSAKGKETLRGVGALEQARPQKDTETFLLPPDRQVRHIFDGTPPSCKSWGSATPPDGYTTKSSLNSGRSTVFWNSLRMSMTNCPPRASCACMTSAAEKAISALPCMPTSATRRDAKWTCCAWTSKRM